MRIQAFRAGLFAIAVALVAASSATAQERVAGPASEGIQVHGHWIIEVYDGQELVERREFENSLHPEGPTLLGDLLSGELAHGGWVIFVGFDLCMANDADHPSSCRIAEPGLFLDTGDITHNLIVSSPESGEQSGTLVLKGSITADLDGTITNVSTRSVDCPPDTSPDSCDTTQSFVTQSLTTKDLSSPVAVVAGQDINVTVIISFTG